MEIRRLNDSEGRGAQFVRFCINGCVAVAVQYGVFWLLLHVGAEKNIAFTVGYIVSFAYNFIMTTLWTFKSRPTWRRFTGFAGSHIVNYLCQMLFLNLFCWFGLTARMAGLAAMVAAVPVNFLLLRFVYKKR